MTIPRHQDGDGVPDSGDPYAGLPYQPMGYGQAQPDHPTAYGPVTGPHHPVPAHYPPYATLPDSQPWPYATAPRVTQEVYGRKIFFRVFALGIVLEAAAWLLNRFGPSGTHGVHSVLAGVGLAAYAVAIVVGLPWWWVDAVRRRPRGRQLAGTLVGAVIVLAAVAAVAAISVVALNRLTSPVSSADKRASAPSAAQLTAMLPQATDLPGWTSSPSTDQTTAAAPGVIPECGTAKSTSSDIIASASAPRLQSATMTVSGSASSFTSPNDVDVDRKQLASSGMPACAREVAMAGLHAGIPATDVLSNPTFTFTPGPNYGVNDVAATASGSFTLTASGKSVAASFTIVLILHDQVEAEVSVESIGPAVPASTIQSVVTAVASRVAKT